MISGDRSYESREGAALLDLFAPRFRASRHVLFLVRTCRVHKVFVPMSNTNDKRKGLPMSKSMTENDADAKVWGVWHVEGNAWCCVEHGPADADTPYRSTRARAQQVFDLQVRLFSPAHHYDLRLYVPTGNQRAKGLKT
jgi:hypothetical protein